LHDSIGELKGADDIAVLLCRHAQAGLELRCENAERIAREIIRDRTETDQRDDPPSQMPYAAHNPLSRFYGLFGYKPIYPEP
jgi:hypothetical protein